MNTTDQPKKDPMRIFQIGAAVLAAIPLLLSGCAGFAESSGSVAESSASMASMASVSASSAGMMASAEKAFQDDVRIAAAASAESGARSAELLRSIGQVAASHGISDWEANSATYYAVGEGLRQGGIDEAGLLAMADELAGENAQAKKSLLAGFRAA